jgi:hypothetical protein
MHKCEPQPHKPYTKRALPNDLALRARKSLFQQKIKQILILLHPK